MSTNATKQGRARTIWGQLLHICGYGSILLGLLLIDFLLRFDELLHQAVNFVGLLAPFLRDLAVPLQALVRQRPNVPVQPFVEWVCASYIETALSRETNNCHYASNGRVLCSSAFMSWKLRPLIRRFIVALSNVLSINCSNIQATKERLGQVSPDEITELPQGVYPLSALYACRGRQM